LKLLACVGLGAADHDRAIAGFVSMLLIPAILARGLTEPARFPEAVPRNGRQPTSMILAEQLDPATLGKLVALCEHSVFTQSAIWAIDSFDQWGVELGKLLAGRIIPELDRGAEPQLAHDASTNSLISRYRR
jgi:glucose-6-phosphate isomerase